ncbi:MAG: CRISPR-associated helicase Cas3', partial [Planctomycetes bacterium]|nr:CRISPR-associated helicase Cas3' [Planctomycetota bacterium]
KWAMERLPKLGKILAYVIAGHHSGLLDYSAETLRASLSSRLEKRIPDWRVNAPRELLFLGQPPLFQFDKTDCFNHAAFKVAFWIRMIFSALVDADFLATEAFMNPERSSQRAKKVFSLAEMKRLLDSYMYKKTRGADKTWINAQRANILTQCRNHATDDPGFFDLCVPTGGGKTLASLVFALDHAIEHDLSRVIVAVPFTSIIEQNTKEFRSIFSDLEPGTVLEHHSNLDPVEETGLNRLQSENWDAPLVVTTNVQFFESMFACRTSRCRKLHRLAKSVIILDEVQTLPVDLLQPTLWALRELVECYGCTVVLCTATQPALVFREGFDIGLKNVRSIIENPQCLYETMKRTRVKVVDRLDDEDLKERILDNEQALCIVNTRLHAARLAGLLGDLQGHYHLSTRMCAAHRLEVLDEIRERLKDGTICRVVSTQLVEAGVDVDFPTVYRARCGLDSLAQAAGRCNREGRHACGEVVFFSTVDLPPLGFLRKTAQRAEELLSKFQDPLSPEAIEAYFRLHYWLSKDRWDYRKVLNEVGNQPDKIQFQFAEMAHRYRFIREESTPVLIPWRKEGNALVKKQQRPGLLDRGLWRMLQRYSVQVRQHELHSLKDKGVVELFGDCWVLTTLRHYSELFGLEFDQAWDAEELII